MMLASIWLWIQTRAVLIGAAALGVFIAILKIRKSGADAERVRNLEATLKSIREKEGVKREIDRLPSGSAADRLRDKWSRD